MATSATNFAVHIRSYLTRLTQKAYKLEYMCLEILQQHRTNISYSYLFQCTLSTLKQFADIRLIFMLKNVIMSDIITAEE